MLLVLSAFACSDDSFPPGLYNYQVERLLSADSSKIWLFVSELNNGTEFRPTTCSDSTHLYITSVAPDSIHIARLIPKDNCSAFDTLKLGNANASGELLFTDTLSFASGEYWFLEEITAQKLSFFTSREESQSYRTSPY